MDQITHRLILDGMDATLTWLGQGEVEPARVYALAFTSKTKLMLVSGGPHDPHRWLPGGGVEAGENPPDALRRELLEEADATILSMEELGSQHVAFSDGRQEYQRYYWCRVVLAPQVQPRSESTQRHLVSPDNFLDTLEWGHKDPKAAVLLKLALESESRFSAKTA